MVITEVNSELLKNILAQGDALRLVAAHFGAGGRDELVRCAELLKGRTRMIVTGMGASLFASMPFPYLIRDWQASVIESAELIHFLSELVTRDTALILVSRSGESVEVIKLLELAREHKALTIAISNIRDSTLLRDSTLGILLHSPVDQLVAVQTYTATVAVIVFLAAAFMGDLEAAITDLAMVARFLPQWIDECLAQSAAWNELTQPGLPLYLLSRGPGLATVSEGVLLMHEVAKTPAVGMSVPQFRHGAVETVDKNFRAIVIGTQRSTAPLDWQFSKDLMNMGATIRWLGPAAGQDVVPLCQWPDKVPGRFSPIVEAIALQLLAYTTAEARGIEVVPFRWAPAVTASETGFLSHA